nr:hypothetical protein [Natrinema soli]
MGPTHGIVLSDTIDPEALDQQCSERANCKLCLSLDWLC